jgi:hypothetical protein
VSNIHVRARELAGAALMSVLGENLEHPRRVLAGVAFLETGYGRGWSGPGKGSFNMGAIQAGPKWTGDVFVYVDTHPNPDGTSTRYEARFRKYPTEEAGWADLARIVFVSNGRKTVYEAAKDGDLFGVSTALHRTGYYEGFGATVAARVANHHKALRRAVDAADKAVSEWSSIQPETTYYTLRRGSGYTDGHAEAVKALQRALGLVADGLFGPGTEAAVRAFQQRAGLVCDGVVGPKTWQVVLAAAG